MKCLVTFFTFLLNLQANASSQFDSMKVDTSVVLGVNNNEVLILDSKSFVELKIMFNESLIKGDYFSDSIIKYQNSLFKRLRLTNIDTLLIDGFLEKIDISNLLASFENVNAVIIHSYGDIQIIKPCNNPKSKIDFIQLVSVTSLEVDLQVVDFFQVSALVLDVEQENKYEHLCIENKSDSLKELIFSSYFPKFRKFVRKNKLKNINEQIDIVQMNIVFKLINSQDLANPHKKL